ncbi:TonB-dependent receptor [Caulobacter sp. SLTY]|uniref:TonB-dependent receptor n=1 Tax=Caulobacter sp. SLTY TaxID=2683262 RepID=UPI001412C8EE|nr:TonB-dependent receptor [Caulobacter sp. SLTY]NBB15223.1 TonB-dependent receptor [Caulobacter sp. SLTY]
MYTSLRLRKALAVSASAFAIMAVAAPAFAQEEAPSGTTVGELIITAQKREEAIQDVPIAVSAFNQETLEKQKIDGGPNLVLAIPNVNFSKGNFTGYNFQIRGIGSKLVAGSGDAGTGIHLNNAPLTANNLFESEFFDLERVEVLRGPQGTLYGRNATGGVVNVISAKPIDSFEAMIKAEVGNYESYKLRGMINVPIGDTIAVRLAGNVFQRGGYGTNLVTGNEIDDRDLWNTRLTVSFEPVDEFRTYFLWDHFEEDDKRSRIGKQYCTKDPGPATVGGFGYSADPARATAARGLLSQGCLPTSLYSANVLGTPNSQGTLGGLLGNLSGLITGDAFAGKMQNKDIRNIESAVDPVYQVETDIIQFGATWDITDELSVISLTNYSKNYLFTKQDYNRVTPINTFNTVAGSCNNFTPVCSSSPAAQQVPTAIYNGLYASLFPGGVVNDPQVGARNSFTTFDISGGDAEQWSQELRLASNFDGPFNFNIGAIYLDLKTTDGHYYVFGNTLTGQAQIANALVTGNPNCSATTAGCIFIDPSPSPSGSGRNYFDSTGDYHLKSRAAFGEVYWQVLDSVKITGGIRYTHDRKLQQARTTALLAGNTPATPGSDSTVAGVPPVLEADFKEVTGRLGADWKPTDNNLLYLFYSRGYKAGGVNPPCAVGVACAAPTFDPEFVDAWELGSKNTLFDGRMVLNATYFRYDYIGYQVSKITNRQSVNENIDAKIQGLEFETIWEPIDNFRINMNIGLLDSEITDGESIDVFNRTQGDPTLTVVKASNASNCVASTAGVGALLNAINNFGVSPYALLGLCSGAFASTNPAVNPLAALGVVSNPALLPNGGDGIAVDLEGKELPNAPKYTFSLGAQYTWNFGGWDATLRGDYYRQDDSFSRIYNSEPDKIKGWQNVNATLTVGNQNIGLYFELFVKNLTDEESITDTYLTDDSSGLFRNAFFTEPQTFGISITKTFGQ